MIGKTISHYKILEKLGEGGMGKVYKAEDTKLKRTVALKFLPHHLIAGKSIKERFFHEARAASALNHPNIITIHDIHEEDGEVFLAMECVDGVLLSEKLKDGPLKQKELIDIATGIADGLNTAHNADITHRDIKSENIIITKDGQAKIIDFGLAKQKGMSQITQDGTTMGTQAYMSPEQVQSSKIDQRSDIFSFGVVMYQMATGKLPFEGEHDAAILYSIVNEAPIPVTTHNPNLDEELQRIIHKALEKDVKDRYQHADDLLADLRKLKKGSTPKPTKTKAPIWRILVYIFGGAVIGLLIYLLFIKGDAPVGKSIAVLPFTTIDRTEESEIFGEGIHDYLLSQIAKIHDLKVIARTSVLSYKNTDKRVSDIANELGVETILEGSVYRSGDKIRIIAQLINAETEDHIWSETYDREYAEIFTIQSDVANKIAKALKATLTINEKKSIDEIPTSNLEAYEYYLLGRAAYFKRKNLEDVESSVSYIKKAISLDPNFALAHAFLSRLYSIIRFGYYNMSETVLNNAKQSLDIALELDPAHPEVILAEGIYYYYCFKDYEKALEKFDSALKERPNDSELLLNVGFVKRRQGQWEEALNMFIRSSNIDPKSVDALGSVAYIARRMRKWELVENYYDRLIELNPLDENAYYLKFLANVTGKGDLDRGRLIVDEALEHLPPKELISLRYEMEKYSGNYLKAYDISLEYKVNKDDPDYYGVLFIRGEISSLLGFDGLSKTYYDSLVSLCINNPDIYVSHGFLAMAYGRLGLKDKALNQIEICKTKVFPGTTDAIIEADWQTGLVDIYISIGEFDLAIDIIDDLLSKPSRYTVLDLELDPLFNPLRELPRFQELIEKYKDTEG